MAVTRGKSPVVMTAQGDTLSESGSVAREWKVSEIRVVNSSTPGDVVIKDQSGGQEVFRSNSLGANDVDSLALGDSYWTDDLYVDTLPSGAKVYVYYL